MSAFEEVENNENASQEDDFFSLCTSESDVATKSLLESLEESPNPSITSKSPEKSIKFSNESLGESKRAARQKDQRNIETTEMTKPVDGVSEEILSSTRDPTDQPLSVESSFIMPPIEVPHYEVLQEGSEQDIYSFPCIVKNIDVNGSLILKTIKNTEEITLSEFKPVKPSAEDMVEKVNRLHAAIVTPNGSTIDEIQWIDTEL